MNSEAEVIEEELVYGARRRELMWQKLGLTGMGFGMAGCPRRLPWLPCSTWTRRP